MKANVRGRLPLSRDLQKKGTHTILLDVQFRTLERIYQVTNHIFYDGKIQTHEPRMASALGTEMGSLSRDLYSPTLAGSYILADVMQFLHYRGDLQLKASQSLCDQPGAMPSIELAAFLIDKLQCEECGNYVPV